MARAQAEIEAEDALELPADVREQAASLRLQASCLPFACTNATASARRRVIPAERAWLRAVDANHRVILEITEQPAHTLAGVIFKAEVSDRDGNAEPGLMESIVADLVAMGGAHA